MNAKAAPDKRAEARGRHAEERAAEWMISRGYSALGRRIRTAEGELDRSSPMRSGWFLSRSRRGGCIAGALDSISLWQRRSLVGAAAIVVARRPD